MEAHRRTCAMLGATLIFVGLVTGLWAGVALNGTVEIPVPRLALAAHLNGLLGGLWLIALAWTLPFLHYGDKGRKTVMLLTAFVAWDNWFVTLIASFVGRTGLKLTGELRNDIIGYLLYGTVVLPGLVASGMWAWGFRKKKD